MLNNRVWSVLTVIGAAGLLSMAACGDDDDEGTGGGTTATGTATGTGGNTNTGGSTNTGGTTGTGGNMGGGGGAGFDNPFEDYDCSGYDPQNPPDPSDSEAMCLYSICQMEQGFDATADACSQPSAPAYCDAILTCYVDYLSCIDTMCQTAYDATEAAACATTLSECTTAAMQ